MRAGNERERRNDPNASTHFHIVTGDTGGRGGGILLKNGQWTRIRPEKKRKITQRKQVDTPPKGIVAYVQLSKKMIPVGKSVILTLTNAPETFGKSFNYHAPRKLSSDRSFSTG